MKLLFDNQIFDLQKYGGISRYFSELFKTLNYSNIEYDLPIRDCNNEYLRKISPFKEKNLLPRYFYKLKGKSLLYKIADIFDKKSNKNLIIKALKKQDFDIFHPTYYSTYFLQYIKNKKFVLTIYDMIHEIYPEYFKLDGDVIARNKKFLALRAEKIITISESTKNDIIKFYNIPEKKIEVIYLANSLMPVIKKPFNAPMILNKYILFVGSRALYKNFIYFIKSIAILLKNDSNLNVVVFGGYSGKNSFSDQEKNIFLELGIEKQIFQYSGDDNVLAYLYQNALCFVFPTLYEGFGIPVLEAFACDCPAVISNSSSLPEVGGQAAIYFDPFDGDDMMSSIKDVIYDENLRAELIIKGKEQLKKFSWEKTSKKTIELYLSIK